MPIRLTIRRADRTVVDIYENYLTAKGNIPPYFKEVIQEQILKGFLVEVELISSNV